MSFVKLDTGILDSTLWITRDPREIFITALLMALPHEFDEPVETYKVHSLEKAAFVVPPGWYGFIGASGPGIVRRAGLPADAGLEALAALGEPDPESRSSDWEGRRMVRVDGGFVVLNFMKYRDKDNTAAARQARYRERQRGNLSVPNLKRNAYGVAVVTRDGDAETRNCRQAEAEAEAEADKYKDKYLPPNGGYSPAVADEHETGGDEIDLVGHKLNGRAPKTTPDCPHVEVLDLWAEVMPDLPQHDRELWSGSARADHLRARWKQTAALKGWQSKADGLAYFRKLFGYCRHSDFLMGKSQSRERRPFALELGWLVNATNWTKVHEGKFNG